MKNNDVTILDGDETNTCSKDCVMSSKINKKCSSIVENDEQGRCYRTCPYECLNTSSSSSCKYDSECMGCGVSKFRVNCDGTLKPEWGDNTTLDDKEKKSNKLKKSNKINIAKNINSVPYIDPEEPVENSTEDIKPECCGDINYHYYMLNSNPSGSILDDIARSGGIISNKLQNGINNAIAYRNKITSSPTYNSDYNYGAPGTKFPTDSQGALEQYTVKYETRPSVTGMFNVTGPLGANIGMYGNHLEGCNCPVEDYQPKETQLIEQR